MKRNLVVYRRYLRRKYNKIVDLFLFYKYLFFIWWISKKVTFRSRLTRARSAWKYIQDSAILDQYVEMLLRKQKETILKEEIEGVRKALMEERFEQNGFLVDPLKEQSAEDFFANHSRQIPLVEFRIPPLLNNNYFCPTFIEPPSINNDRTERKFEIKIINTERLLSPHFSFLRNKNDLEELMETQAVHQIARFLIDNNYLYRHRSVDEMTQDIRIQYYLRTLHPSNIPGL